MVNVAGVTTADSDILGSTSKELSAGLRVAQLHYTIPTSRKQPEKWGTHKKLKELDSRLRSSFARVSRLKQHTPLERGTGADGEFFPGIVTRRRAESMQRRRQVAGGCGTNGRSVIGTLD